MQDYQAALQVIAWLLWAASVVAVIKLDQRRRAAAAAARPDEVDITRFEDKSVTPYLVLSFFCGALVLPVYFYATRKTAKGALLGVAWTAINTLAIVIILSLLLGPAKRASEGARVRGYEAECNGGSSYQCEMAGESYLEGMGVPKDATKAALLFGKGCESGSVEACFRLAGMPPAGVPAELITAARASGKTLCATAPDPIFCPALSSLDAPAAHPTDAPGDGSDCPFHECKVLEITDAVLANLERKRDDKKLSITFAKTATPAQFATIARVPWVRAISASNCPIVDLAPLAKLEELRTLNLYATRVVDLAPLAELPALSDLDLGNVQTIVDFAPLTRMRALRRLKIFGTKLEHLEVLAGATELEYLDAATTKVKDLSPLASHKALRDLDVFGNDDVDLSGLRGLAITSLDINAAKLSDLRPLAGLTSLKSLSAFGNPGLKDLTPLRALAALETLDLDRTGVVDVAPLDALPRLKTLHLGKTGVTSLAALARAPALESIYLSGAPVRDLSPLYAVKTLQRVSVDKTFPEDELAKLKAARADVKTSKSN